MFQKIQKKIQEFLKEKGQGVVEYALVLGVVAVIAVYLIGSGGLKEKVAGGLDNVGTATNIINTAMDAVKP